MIGNIASRLRGYIGQSPLETPDSPSIDGRRDQRLNQKDRRVALHIDGQTRTMVLRNLSTRGAAGDVEPMPAVGANVAVEFERGIQARGTVKWAVDGKIGIVFLGCVPMDVVDGSVRNWQARSPRAPRYSVARTATLVTGSTRLPVTVVNVSAAGLRLQTPFPLVPGHSVRIEAGTLTLSGVVRWSKPDSAGIKLDQPLSLDEFDSATENCRVANESDAGG